MRFSSRLLDLGVMCHFSRQEVQQQACKGNVAEQMDCAHEQSHSLSLDSSDHDTFTVEQKAASVIGACLI